MKVGTCISTILALVFLGASPTVQAQDPAAAFKIVQQLRGENRLTDALQRVEVALAVYGNPQYRIGRMFAHYTPFFLWQKASILTEMGEYDKACEVYRDLTTNPRFKDTEMVERSKTLPGQEEGYLPLLTMALFQQGYVRYKQAVGTKHFPGDQDAYTKCIPLLEEYLRLYEAGKVSKQEKQEKLDSRVYLLLLQAYLLQEKPDFEKAGEYMTKMGQTKTLLPDEMVMNGLNTVMTVAKRDPGYIGWVTKMIQANPGNFHVAPHRLAPYMGILYNYGIETIKVMNDALAGGNLDQAAKAAEAANLLTGIMPDTAEAQHAAEGVYKLIGDNGNVRDRSMGLVYSGRSNKVLGEQLAGIVNDHTELEAFGMLQTANAMAKMGSSRLAKAGYKVLIDRYPKLAQKKDGKTWELRDINYLQYSQFCRATGDDKTAVAYETKVNPDNVGDGNKNVVAINKMTRFTKEQKWDQVLPAADEVLAAIDEKSDPLTYVAACFSKIAAYYNLRRLEDVAKEGEKLLKSGLLEEKAGGLNKEQITNYEPQTLFFVMDAYKELGAKDPKNYDRAIAFGDEFIKKYPSVNLEENPLAPNIYFDAIITLLKRRGNGDENVERADLEKSRLLCDVFAENWREHKLYAAVRALRTFVDEIRTSENDANRVPSSCEREAQLKAQFRDAFDEYKSSRTRWGHREAIQKMRETWAEMSFHMQNCSLCRENMGGDTTRITEQDKQMQNWFGNLEKSTDTDKKTGDEIMDWAIRITPIVISLLMSL